MTDFMPVAAVDGGQLEVPVQARSLRCEHHLLLPAPSGDDRPAYRCSECGAGFGSNLKRQRSENLNS